MVTHCYVHVLLHTLFYKAHLGTRTYFGNIFPYLHINKTRFRWELQMFLIHCVMAEVGFGKSAQPGTCKKNGSFWLKISQYDGTRFYKRAVIILWIHKYVFMCMCARKQKIYIFHFVKVTDRLSFNTSVAGWCKIEEVGENPHLTTRKDNHSIGSKCSSNIMNIIYKK